MAWGFKKARHFLEGCLDLWVGVDHKPLLGLYSPTNALADIENNMLRRLVEKACQYRFTAFHIPGTSNLIADGMSRAPVGRQDHMEVDAVYVTGGQHQLQWQSGPGPQGPARKVGEPGSLAAACLVLRGLGQN